MILLVQHNILCTLSISKNKQLSFLPFLSYFLMCHPVFCCIIAFRLSNTWNGHAAHHKHFWLNSSAITYEHSTAKYIPQFDQCLRAVKRALLNICNLMQICTHQHIFAAFLAFLRWGWAKWQLMCIIMVLWFILLQFGARFCDVTARDDIWTG